MFYRKSAEKWEKMKSEMGINVENMREIAVKSVMIAQCIQMFI